MKGTQDVREWLLLMVGLLGLGDGVAASEPPFRVGTARVDITPDRPIRLLGYASRTKESEGVEQRLWAKALAIRCGADDPALLLSVENCAVPEPVTEEVARRLEARGRLPRPRFVLCSTHTHEGPCLKGAVHASFYPPLPTEHWQTIERYTADLTDRLEKVALEALENCRPAHLAWSQGKVTFAVNRRLPTTNQGVVMAPNPEGPVDHTLPLLRVTDEGGKLVAVALNYACHGTALGGDFNRICGDWPGYAQAYVEREHPGTLCLVTIGFGGDANPHPRTGLEHAQQQGQAIAKEVERLLQGNFERIAPPLTARLERIRLPFEPPPGREVWQERASRQDHVGYHARLQLARLDRGEPLRTQVDYPVQTWVFGKDLAMIFLAGEVVVDYALRLRKELDGSRLWLTAYANDLPCYIPSRRVLAEGGYEADFAMVYYDRPARLRPEVEDLIVATVHRLLPPPFAATGTR